MAVARSFEALLKLSAQERAQLALKLLRSRDDDVDPDSAEAWNLEIERRAAEVESETATTMTLEDFRAHVWARRAARAH